MRLFWRPETGVFLVAWLLLLGVGRSSLLQDPGTFWHTVVGQQVLANGHLPQADAFSFTFAGRHWIASQWLAECTMALLYRWGGLDLLFLGAVTLLAGLAAWLTRRLLQAGLHTPAAAVLLALVFGATSHHFHVRPHLATIAFMGLTFATFCDVEAGRTGLRRLLCLPPLFVVWTNLHGGVLAGLATMVLVFAGWLAARMIGWESPIRTWRQAAGLLAIGTACGAALLVNPYGLEMPRTWLHVMGQDLPDLIEEHAPLKWSHPEAWMVGLLAAAYLAALVGTGFRIGTGARIGNRARWPRATWLLPLAWAWLAVDRVRHAPLMAIVTALAIAELLPHSGVGQWLARRGWMQANTGEPRESARQGRPWWPAAVLPSICVATAVICQIVALPIPLIGTGWAQLDTQVWPVELVPELQRIRGNSPPPAQIFNSLDLGGFVTLYAPGLRTFIDDRCELFGGDFLRDYAAAEQTHPERIDRWADEYAFQHALVRSGSPFDVYLDHSADWSLVAHAQAANLYRRSNRMMASGR